MPFWNVRDERGVEDGLITKGQRIILPKSLHAIATDIIHWKNTEYLLLADLYSKLPILPKLRNISSSTVVIHLNGIVNEHGIPEKLISAIDTQCREKVQVFSTRFALDHVASSPLYAQSNGLIERPINTVKNMFTKTKESGSDHHLARLCLRTTPIDYNLLSTCELLKGRRYKSNLPDVS